MYKLAVWGSAVMAVAAAIAYILMGVGVLTPGNLDNSDMPGFFYVIPVVYVIMGVLVFSRWRKVRIAEAIIVVFTIVVFYAKYAGQPDVMWSAPGLITKIAQALMLAGLLYIIFNSKPVKNPDVIGAPPANAGPNDTAG